jgi:hypothetical protein
MSTATEPRSGGRLQETERIQAGPGPGRGPFGGGMVGQKASAFKPSARRLVARMAPERTKAIAVVVLAVVSVFLTSIGPRLLGKATDLIFAGVIGGALPEGLTKAEAVEQLRRRGEGRYADMVAAMDDRGSTSTSGPSGTCCCSSSPCTSRRRCWPGCRGTSSTTSSRARSCGCARRSRTRSTRSR